ncbi:MAG: hypothetical protein J6R03_06520 [Treponema sp.]|nr:hypothetical protein [Treponema sp.]
MKRLFFVIFSLFLLGGVVSAQSSQIVTDILNTEEVTYGQVCYLSAIHQGFISEDTTLDDAVKILYEKKQTPELLSTTTPACMVNLSYIYMQMWPNVDGGLFFRLTNGSPRYALKKLKADGIIEDTVDPLETLSGKEALDILTSCMLQYGDDSECMTMDLE